MWLFFHTQPKAPKDFISGKEAHLSTALGRLSPGRVQDGLVGGKAGGEGIANSGARMKIQLSLWFIWSWFLHGIQHSILQYQKKIPKQPLKSKMFQVKRTIFFWGNYFIIKYCLTTKQVSGLLSIANKDLYSHLSPVLCFPTPVNTFLHLLMGNWNF